MLASRLSKIKPSATLAVDAKAKAMRAEGIDVVNFGVGEPDFDTPEHIKEAAIKAIQDGFTKYTPVDGIPELKEAIIDRIKQDLGVEYSLSNVLVSCGGKHSLYNIFMALVGKGDEVIIPAPYWVSYPPMVLLAEGEPVIVETREENGFKILPDELASSITPRTKAIILNSPSNPTGSLYTKEELIAIGKILLEKDIYLISDDIYYRILFDNYEFHSIVSLIPELKDKVIMVNGVSKTYSMTGWRIGYMLGPDEVITAARKIQSQSTSNPTSIAQKAAVSALNGPQDCIDEMVQEFAKRRKRILELLDELPGVTCYPPEGAFYVFPNFSAYFGKTWNGKKIEGSVSLSEFFLEEAHVALVPGEAFGADEFIRFSYATSMDRIEEGLRRIKDVLDKLE